MILITPSNRIPPLIFLKIINDLSIHGLWDRAWKQYCAIATIKNASFYYRVASWILIQCNKAATNGMIVGNSLNSLCLQLTICVTTSLILTFSYICMYYGLQMWRHLTVHQWEIICFKETSINCTVKIIMWSYFLHKKGTSFRRKNVSYPNFSHVTCDTSLLNAITMYWSAGNKRWWSLSGLTDQCVSNISIPTSPLDRQRGTLPDTIPSWFVSADIFT